MPMNEQRLPVLRARPGEIADRVLVVGEPARAESCAALLESVSEVGNYREYRTFTGSYKGTPISICSHGVGSGGAAVAFHELFVAGVSTIIRAGTCGAMQPGIEDGQIIVGTGAVRNDGATDKLVPIEYPAVAHHQVVGSLLESCHLHGVDTPPAGVVLTNATLYGGLFGRPIELWVNAGVVAVEMEFATLLVLAGIRNVRAGGLFVSDGNAITKIERGDTGDFSYNPHRDVVKSNTQKMLEIAIDTLATMA